jgi:hypothetical protein
MSTHIRLGGQRIELRSKGSLRDACDLIAALTRGNLRSIQGDLDLRAEALRRTLSPPIGRCHVKQNLLGGGVHHDCNGHSGLQYASDEEAQALEACPARDVWSDWGGLIMGHAKAGRGPLDPIVCDCDDLAPAALSVASWIAWYAPKGAVGLGGRDLHEFHDDNARFAVAITHPRGANIAHAYALTSKKPPAPQPTIRMGSAKEWYVWDPAAHWGMKRPGDEFYENGEVVAFEIRRSDLQGLTL